jgi:hypothetical protein
MRGPFDISYNPTTTAPPVRKQPKSFQVLSQRRFYLLQYPQALININGIERHLHHLRGVRGRPPLVVFSVPAHRKDQDQVALRSIGSFQR